LSLLPAVARAGQLQLRILLTRESGNTDYRLVHVAKGDFQAKAPLQEERAGDLLVVGRDAAGAELFRRAVRNPGVHRAEIFDPATGHIALARDIQRSDGVVEVEVPDLARLRSVDLAERGATSSVPAPIRRIAREELDRMLTASKTSRLAATTAALPTQWLWQSGPTSARWDLVLIGDGYTASQMAQWHADAQTIANGYLADPLFAANKYRMNILRVDIASVDSGVTEGGVTRNTALGTVVGCYATARLVCPDETKVYNAVDPVTPPDGRDLIVVVANTQTYGGSGGNVGAVTMHPQAIEIALHEVGHAGFGLADEYDYGTCATNTEPAEPNVTMAWAKAASKWSSLMSSSTAVPTPTGYYPAATVGLFTGAKYCTSGVYRPTQDSRMRTLGQPWYAVNEARAQVVFNYYAGTSNTVNVSGSLSGPGATGNYPSPNSFYSSAGGWFYVSTVGPSGTNFDLRLYKWNGSGWALVSQSGQNGSYDTIMYSGTGGYYYTAITSLAGSGSYTLSYSFPK
ncbi:MAG TPA: M64 family metallopeptidase, partial [Burkholderiaceae bacterium]